MILLIDNYDSFTYNLAQQLMIAGSEVMVVRNDQTSLDAIEAMNIEAIVLSPGPGHPADAGLCIDIIQRFSGRLPILGVCLGHQAIACAFGGEVVQAPEIVHGKASSVFHSRQGLYQGVNLPLAAGRYHSLIIERESLPNSLSIESETADGTIMGIKHQQHPTFGVQFHPESVLSDQGQTLLANFVALVKSQQPIAA